MNAFPRTLLCAGLLLSFAHVARGQLITYNLTQVTADTLKSLGTNFLLGCIAIAAIVLAALIKRKSEKPLRRLGSFARLLFRYLVITMRRPKCFSN